MNKHEEWNKTFDDWWDSDKPEQVDNPYRPDSAAYWAYGGWVSGRKAMLEEVLTIIDSKVMKIDTDDLTIELKQHFGVK